MFGTSFKILSVIFCSIGQSINSIDAVIASIVFTARIITGQSYERALLRTPTDLKSGTIVKYCHTVLSSPAILNSSRSIASLSRSASNLSRVIAPKQRTPNPGPGNGWRYTISYGKPNSNPHARTSSLNS